MKTKLPPLQTRVMRSLNNAGISDREGQLYDTSAHNVTRFILRKVRRTLVNPKKHQGLVQASARLLQYCLLQGTRGREEVQLLAELKRALQ